MSDSVEAFYSDAKIRTAVSLIVDQGTVFAPEDAEEWATVETYYDAVLAALQTQVEHAKDLFRLWGAVWQNIPDDWVSVPADVKDEELSLDASIRWDEDYFERHFRFRHRTIKLWVMLGESPNELDEVEIAFDVAQGSKSVMRKGAPWTEHSSAWRFANGAMRLTNNTKYEQGLDLTELRTGALEAITFIRDFEA